MSVPIQVALNDLAAIERDSIDPTGINTGTLYVGLENIESGGRLVGVRSVDAGELASSKFAFTSRHLLYGKLRPYLAKIARPDFKGICSTDILPVLPGPELDRGYLAWILLTPEMVSLASSRATGANLPRLSPSALGEFKIPLPPLPVQRRIAEILDKADVLRSMRRAAIAHLNTLTQSIFLDMFGDPATNPRRWLRASLGDLITVGPQNGLYKPSEDYGSGTPILRIDAFYDGVVTKLGRLKRVRLAAQEQNLYALRAGEIVINRVNSREYLGKSAIIPELNETTVFESNMMRFDVNRDALEPVYLIEYLQTDLVRAHVDRSAKDAVNQSSINQRDVKAIPLIVPPIALQRLFVKRVSVAKRHIKLHDISLTALDSLFASLQHFAFRGAL